MATQPKNSKKRRAENSTCAENIGTLRDVLIDALSFFPKELSTLVLESVVLPYRYTWRSNSLVDVDTVEFSASALTTVLAQPAFQNPNSGPSPSYIADWVIRVPTCKLDVGIWVGLVDPTVAKVIPLKILIESSTNGSLIVGGVSFSTPETSSLLFQPLHVSTRTFFKHGLRFSVDLQEKAIRISVGNNPLVRNLRT